MQEIDGYKIGELIGKGSIGTVYEGVDRADQHVAVKIMELSPFIGEPLLDSVIEGADVIRKISNHEHIVRIRDAGREGDRYYMIMDLYKWGTLERIMPERDLKTKLKVAASLAKTLSYVHSKGIIHGDLKPSNILMGEDGEPCLNDFYQASKNARGRQGVALPQGTPRYMSPEQALGRMVTQATDIYSFGVLFYELFTGSIPYERQAENVTEMVDIIQNSAMVPAKRRNSKVSSKLNAVLMKCLQRKRDQRYQRMTLVAKDLEACLNGGKPSVSYKPTFGERFLSLFGKAVSATLAITMAATLSLSWGCKTRQQVENLDVPVEDLDPIEKIADHVDEVKVASAVNELPPPEPKGPYELAIGDVVEISVMGKPEMTRDVKVLPDGTITYLLVGEIMAENLTISKLRDEITQSLKTFAKPRERQMMAGPYRMHVGDVLEISVLDEPEMTCEVTVIPDGSITYFLVGELQAEGKTIEELRSEIAESLETYFVNPKVSVLTKKTFSPEIEEDALANPMVSVIVKELRDPNTGEAFVSILGAVKNPDRYKFKKGDSLVDLVARAGGFLFITNQAFGGRPIANFNTSYITRRGKKLDVDFDSLFRLGNMDFNIPLEKDDFVYIGNAESDQIYVLGEVNMPKPVPFSEKDVSLAKVLAWAGGFTERAQKSRVMVLRSTEKDNKFIEVDVESLLLGDEDVKNVRLKGGDIVFVPEQGISEYARYARYLMDFADLLLKGYQIREAVLFPRISRDDPSGNF